jgi:sec-independent protein translocase protein TatA
MLNNAGPLGLLVIALVVLVLFGRGRIGALMGEVGTGISSLKRGLRDGDDEEAAVPLEPARERDRG